MAGNSVRKIASVLSPMPCLKFSFVAGDKYRGCLPGSVARVLPAHIATPAAAACSFAQVA